MSSDLTIKSRLLGGFFRAMMRKMFGGESFFLTEYTSPGQGFVSFSPRVPGTILHQKLQGNSLFLTAGSFLACTRYPECKNAKTFEYDPDGNIKIIEKAEPVIREDIKCEKCGKPMAVRSGRFGKFLGCTGYPKCRNIKGIDENGNPVDPKQNGKGQGKKKSGGDQAVLN